MPDEIDRMSDSPSIERARPKPYSQSQQEYAPAPPRALARQVWARVVEGMRTRSTFSTIEIEGNFVGVKMGTQINYSHAHWRDGIQKGGMAVVQGVRTLSEKRMQYTLTFNTGQDCSALVYGGISPSVEISHTFIKAPSPRQQHPTKVPTLPYVASSEPTALHPRVDLEESLSAHPPKEKRSQEELEAIARRAGWIK